MRPLNQQTMTRMAEYINEYQQRHRLSPSFRTIMHDLDIPSLSTVQRYVLALENEGRISRTRIGNIEMPRHLKLNESTVAPLVGYIACGQPTFAEEHIEASYALPAEIFGSGDLFMLRAFGDSMIEAGISAGDLLVLRKQHYADDGDIVVALTDGETTLKRFYRQGRKIILHPENRKMKDIVLTECDVQGVLVSCIKQFQ